MQRVAKSLRFALGALLAVALVLSPVAAFAAPQPAHHPSDTMAGDGGAPCDMPCEGCGDEMPSLSCAMACLGLFAAMPPAAIIATSSVRAMRVEAHSHSARASRDREPDKPPPRHVLA
jgi:hypothetical protein